MKKIEIYEAFFAENFSAATSSQKDWSIAADMVGKFRGKHHTDPVTRLHFLDWEGHTFVWNHFRDQYDYYCLAGSQTEFQLEEALKKYA